MSGAAAADTVTKYVAFDPNVRLRSGSSINEQQPIHIINKMNTHTHTSICYFGIKDIRRSWKVLDMR